MRSLSVLVGMVVLGCGGASSVGPEVVAAPAPLAPEVATSPSKALHLSFGLIYAGNMMGELEPCG